MWKLNNPEARLQFNFVFPVVLSLFYLCLSAGIPTSNEFEITNLRLKISCIGASQLGIKQLRVDHKALGLTKPFLWGWFLTKNPSLFIINNNSVTIIPKKRGLNEALITRKLGQLGLPIIKGSESRSSLNLDKGERGHSMSDPESPSSNTVTSSSQNGNSSSVSGGWESGSGKYFWAGSMPRLANLPLILSRLVKVPAFCDLGWGIQ